MGLHRHISQDCMSLGNENVCVCSVQQGSHWPQVAGEHLKYSQCDWASELSPYFILINWKLTLITIRSWRLLCSLQCSHRYADHQEQGRGSHPGCWGAGGGRGHSCAVGKTTSGMSSGFSFSPPSSARPRGCADSALYPSQLLYSTRQTGTRGGAFTWIPLPLGARAALQKLWFIHCKSGSLAAPWCDLQAACAVPVSPGP